jgi:hypothetical protein
MIYIFPFQNLTFLLLRTIIIRRHELILLLHKLAMDAKRCFIDFYVCLSEIKMIFKFLEV